MTKERRTPRSRATGSLRPCEQAVIEAVRPSIEAGRFAAKALVGENFAVEAFVFRHGHERLRAALRWRVPNETTFHEAPMTLFNPGLDLWRAEIPLERVGRHHYRVVAWKDPYASWVEELGKRVWAAQADVSSEIAEGPRLGRSSGKECPRRRAVRRRRASAADARGRLGSGATLQPSRWKTT